MRLSLGRARLLIAAAALAVPVRAQTDLFAGSCTLLEPGNPPGAQCDVQVLDVDGDSVIDIVQATRSSDPAHAKADILFGVPRESPSLFAAAPLAAQSLDVRAADVTGDGAPDLVAVTSSSLLVRPGFGDGTFGLTKTSPLGLSFVPLAVRLEVADVDGDGKLDAVVGHGLNQPGLIFAHGRGDGLFAPAVEHGISSPLILQSQRPLVADFDSDGIADVLCPFDNTAPGGNSLVVLMPGTGGGGFGPQQLVLPGVLVNSLATAQLTPDASPDLAAGTPTGVRVYRNDGAGHFTLVTSLTGFSSVQVQPGDVNADGLTDIVALADDGAGTILSFLGNASGSFHQVGSPPTVGATSIALGDLNADGALDVAFGDGTFHHVGLLNGAGDGTFAGPAHVAGFQPRDLAAGDLNGDGRSDVVSADFGAMTVSALLALDGGAFAPAVAAPVTQRPILAGVADVDGGFPDVVVLTTPATGAASRLEVLHGAGDGTLAAGAVIEPGGTLMGLALADTNGDGQRDVVTSRAGELLVLLGAGDGTFGAPVASPGVLSASLAVADLDTDGTPDVAFVGTPGGSGNAGLSFLHGLGAGAFGPPALIVDPGGASFLDVAVGDFNGDGRPDVAGSKAGSPSALDGTVTTALSLGGGAFGPAEVIQPGMRAWQLAAGDLNADGLDDLAVVGNGTTTLAVLASLGDAGFAPAQHYADGSSDDSTLVLGDFDGNGRLDLVAGGFSIVALMNTLHGWFAPLDGGTIGAHGVPRLSGIGELLGADPVKIVLRSARPEATVAMVLGLQAVGLPLAGSVLVPEPTAIVTGLEANADGELHLVGQWPAGLPAGLHLYFQMWVADPLGPSGFAASTSMVATTPW